MDLSLIQTHLDNFVHTWEGWGKVVGGLLKAFDYFGTANGGNANAAETGINSLKGLNLFAGSSQLSSK